MTIPFVPYTPDVEHEEPDFAQTLRTVIEQTTHYVAGSIGPDGVGRALRDAHAKAYGLARAELEIVAGLPEAYAQGIYATPGRHEALVRFSNGSPHVGADSLLGMALGMGLKIFGVDGPTVLGDEPDRGNMDYANINAPVFFVSKLKDYVFVQELFLGPLPPPDSTPAERRAGSYRFLSNFLTGGGRLPQDQWLWDEVLVAAMGLRISPANLLLSTYWTMGAVRHGRYVAKVRVAPVADFADRVTRRELDVTAAPEVYRPALVEELREHPYEFEVQVQLCVDLERMPVEVLTTEWPERLSPFVTVARLRLPQQDIGGDDNLERADGLSFNPWRCTEEHRPLGNIMRARSEVYRQSSILRHRLNHQARAEPGCLADVFGE
jgi:hypothetical protein